MHHIYHTEGIILWSRNYREADKHFFVFTRELGLVRATASGVRQMHSRLRYILQDYNFVKVDLVRGRDFWRITSASKTEKLPAITKRPEALLVFGRLARLLERLLAGEDPNEALFADFVSGLEILESAGSADVENLEVIIVLRLLHNLGYVGEGGFADLIKSPFEQELVYKISPRRREVLREINRALKESHL